MLRDFVGNLPAATVSIRAKAEREVGLFGSEMNEGMGYRTALCRVHKVLENFV